jgi:CelD/BcsL family acetyltransferase involved in cellulose biosynthesis
MSAPAGTIESMIKTFDTGVRYKAAGASCGRTASGGPAVPTAMNIPGAESRSRRPSDSISVEDISSLASIEGEWRDLERRNGVPTPFQTWEWCSGWLAAKAASAAPHEEVRLVVVRENGHLVQLWPLAVRTLWVFRIASWLGEPLTQYGDVIAESSDRSASRSEAAWCHIRGWRDIDAMELRRVRSDAGIKNLLIEHGAACATTSSAPFIDFTAANADGRPAWLRSSRTRNSLRRRLGELGTHGTVGFEVLADADEQIGAVAAALRLKRDWLKETGRASMGLSHPAAGAFLASLASTGSLFVARLRVAQATAAVEIGLRRNEKYYSFLQAYEPRFAAAAPGRLLFWHLIERCPDLGVKLFDFLAPAYPHKQEWATGECSTQDFVVPITTKGQVALSYLARIKPQIKLIHAQLPAAARRITASLALTIN